MLLYFYITDDSETSLQEGSFQSLALQDCNLFATGIVRNVIYLHPDNSPETEHLSLSSEA